MKLDELEASIDMNDPDIIVLTEVLPKNNRYTLQKSELETKGYTRLTRAWQYFGTLTFELFLEILRTYVDKINFLFLC